LIILEKEYNDGKNATGGKDARDDSSIDTTRKSKGECKDDQDSDNYLRSGSDDWYR